jgi:Pentapeptide repeats (9 copies)
MGMLMKPFTYCCRPILEGSQFCFWHTRNTEKYAPAVMQAYFGDNRDLKQAVEQEKRALSGAFLRNAAIGGNMLSRGTDLSGADLRAADLQDAHLSYGSLNGANLAMANLDSAFLSDVDIRNAIFRNANLHNVKFRRNNFSGVTGLSRESFVGYDKGFFARPEVLEKYPEYAEETYRSLMTLFSSLSQLDDASWAAFRSRIMRHRRLKQKVKFSNHLH